MKLTALLLLTACCGTRSFAQSDTAALAASDSVPNASTFTLGAVYANNASYYGQRAAENMPYLAAVASYRHKSGLYLTGMAYRLLNDSGTAVSAGALGAGFNFPLVKNLTADISYSHTFYPAHSPFLQAANADNLSASLTLDNWLSTTASADYAFGKTQDIFVSLGTSKFINLGSLFGPKDFISITPAIEAVAGTQHFYQSYVEEKRFRDSLLGILLPVLGGGNNGNSNTKTTVATSFDMISYSFKLPLAYNRAHYLVEAAYQLSVLHKQEADNRHRTNSFFTVSFYYQF